MASTLHDELKSGPYYGELWEYHVSDPGYSLCPEFVDGLCDALQRPQMVDHDGVEKKIHQGLISFAKNTFPDYQTDVDIIYALCVNQRTKMGLLQSLDRTGLTVAHFDAAMVHLVKKYPNDINLAIDHVYGPLCPWIAGSMERLGVKPSFRPRTEW